MAPVTLKPSLSAHLEKNLLPSQTAATTNILRTRLHWDFGPTSGREYRLNWASAPTPYLLRVLAQQQQGTSIQSSLPDAHAQERQQQPNEQRQQQQQDQAVTSTATASPDRGGRWLFPAVPPSMRRQVPRTTPPQPLTMALPICSEDGLCITTAATDTIEAQSTYEAPEKKVKREKEEEEEMCSKRQRTVAAAAETAS